MPRRTHPCTVLGLFLAASTTLLTAQTTTTGGLSGTALAADGRPLSEVRVTITSAQIVRTAMTDASGKFQLGLLNPGPWKLSATRKDFQPISLQVTISANATTPVNLKMKDIASATVAVLATSSEIAIDNTTTAVGMSVTSEVFNKLPVGRNMNDLAYLAPSSNFGGTMSEGRGLDYSISGGSGAENQFILDGLTTNDPRYGGQSTELVTDFIDSVSVETGGFKPEYSAMGGVMNAITKSGSNNFQASTWATFSPSNLQAKAKSNLAGFRQQAPADRYDLGFDIGGPLVKDKLFVYAGVDFNYLTLTPYPNSSGNLSPDQKTNSTQGIMKLNWFLTQDQQVSASINTTSQNSDAPGAVPLGYGNANYGRTRKYDTTNLSLIYDWTISSALLVSLKAGSSEIKSTTTPNDTVNVSVTDYAWYLPGGGGGDQPDLSTFGYARGGYGSYNNEKGTTKQYKGDLSWFAGDHALKVGFAVTKSDYFRQDFASGPGDNLTWVINDMTSVTSTLYGNIGGATVSAETRALYVQDTWEIMKGFRAFYGFRGETQEQFGADGKPFLRFTQMGQYLQPRLGFTWDVNNDGKTKVSGSYAWYYEILPQRMGIREFASQKYLNTTYDLTTYSSTGIGTIGAVQGVTDYGGFFDSPPVANNIKLPKREEVTLGLEHAFPDNHVFTLNGTYRKLTNPIEDSTLVDASGNGYMNLPNGALGMIWNPKPSVSWVAKAGTADALGNPIGGQTITVSDTFFPEAYNKFLALSIGLKHQTATTYWSATYTWSHLYGNYDGVIAPDYGGGGQPDGNITASYDFWPYVGTGNLGLDRRHTFKFYGMQKFNCFGQGINVGGKWTWQTGLPISLIDDGSSSKGLPPGTNTANSDYSLDPGYYGNSTYDHGLVGNHGRTPTVSLVDLHVDLEIAVGSTKIIPSFDLFNAFNSRTTTSVWQFATKQSSGLPDPLRYGQPQEWLVGRRVQAGVKVRF